MPVTGDQVADISRATVDLYRAAERAIVAEVTRRLNDGMDAPDWAVTRLGALSTLRRTVERILSVVTQAAASTVRETLARAYRLGRAEATTGLPARLLPRDSDAVRAGTVLTQVPRAGLIENLAAALIEDVGQRHSNVVRNVTDVYRQVIAEATAVSVAGGMTRRQAAQNAYQRLVDKGVTSFTDRSGRRWRLTSYVEMGVRTVTQRAAVQGQVDRQAQLGLPFVVVSNEVQECELCRPFEGQVLRHDNGPTGRIEATNPVTRKPVTVRVVATLDGARARGFQHPNCRHSVRAYLPGVTRLPEPPTEDPEGDEARQRQRAIERAIRRWKEREQAAFDPSAAAEARKRVRLWQGKMRDHLAANPQLKRLPYREQIGAGNLPPGHPAPAASPTPPPPAPPTPAAATSAASSGRPPLAQRTPVTTPPPRTDRLADLVDLDLGPMQNRIMARDVLGEVIGGEYAGLAVEILDVTAIGVGTSREGIKAIGRIYPGDDLDADPVGEVERGFYRDRNGALVAVHAYLRLNREQRGLGFAGAFNAALEVWYREQGIERIEVHANIDVGGYTWAAQGFEFVDEEDADDILDLVRAKVHDFNALIEDYEAEAEEATGDERRSLRRRIELMEAQVADAEELLEQTSLSAFGSDEYPSSYEISQVGRMHDTGDQGIPWIGKAAMLGSDWHGVKWLL